MKIAISSTGKTPENPIDPRFGRAEWFMLFDTDTGECTPHTNVVSAGHGAGIQTAQFVASLGAEAVISCRFGPNAMRVLKEASVAAWLAPECTVKEALDAFQAGTLREAVEPGTPLRKGA